MNEGIDSKSVCPICGAEVWDTAEHIRQSHGRTDGSPDDDKRLIPDGGIAVNPGDLVTLDDDVARVSLVDRVDGLAYIPARDDWIPISDLDRTEGSDP